MNPNRQATEPAVWVCTPCAKAAGGRMPDGHVATFHEGTCCVCKKQAVVTEPRDYRWVNGRPMVPTAEVEVSPTWGQRRVQMSDDAATAISFLMGLAALFLWGWAR